MEFYWQARQSPFQAVVTAETSGTPTNQQLDSIRQKYAAVQPRLHGELPMVELEFSLVQPLPERHAVLDCTISPRRPYDTSKVDAIVRYAMNVVETVMREAMLYIPSKPKKGK